MPPTFKLKGGYTTRDPRLDRLVQFDERSRQFPIRALIPDKAKPRSFTWSCPVQLDQGQEGACTGFGVAQEGAARPVKVKDVTDAVAQEIYHRARQLDEWPGEDYEGSSVIAAVKAAQEKGWYPEYRWAFGLDDALLALSYHGPVVIGINWYSGMFTPDSDNTIHVTGDIEGGHCTLLNKINVKKKRVGIHNSWGGDCNAELSWDDLDRLLHEQGEACVPVKRAYGPKA